jgi:hypothetical protein
VATASVAMRVHAVGGSGVPEVEALLYNSGSVPAIVIGTVVIITGGYVVVAGADPSEIVGVALQAAGTNPGLSAANSPTTITGVSYKVSTVRPNDQTIFAAQFTNGSSTLVTPAQTDVNVQYGITAYSGIWTVDKAKTGGSARVEVVGFDTNVYTSVVFFKFLASVLSSN